MLSTGTEVMDAWLEALDKDPALANRVGYKKHQHQYTIPVEWEYGEYNWIKAPRPAELLWKKASEYTHKKVTKLRCSCGDEVNRG